MLQETQPEDFTYFRGTKVALKHNNQISSELKWLIAV